jgi:PAS domain S-box-containing protein
VVEPSARAVARHARQLHEQSAGVRNLALVAEHTSALVLISGRDDQLQWVNAAFEKVTGWPLQEVLGRTPYSLLTHASEDPVVHQRVAQAVRLGHGLRHEWLRRARDGRDLWLDIDLRPVHDDRRALRGFVRVCSDTTARVQQQAKLAALWAALPAGVTVLDADARIVDANREAERMLGLSLAQMQGRAAPDPRWRCLRADGSDYPPDELPAVRTLATGLPLHNETMGVHTPAGDLRWLMVNTQPQRNSAGQVSGVVACFSDITVSRELQQRLHVSARTDALTRMPNRSVVLERVQRAIEHRADTRAMALRCCSWMSTASSRSTTPWATAPVTSCCARWPRGWKRRCAPAMPSHAWVRSCTPLRASAAMNSSSCSKASTMSTRPARWPTACWSSCRAPSNWARTRCMSA